MSNSTLTKRALAMSLRRKLEAAPSERPTVSAIAADCGINRQTFYYHFSDIYDLMRWMVQDEVSTLLRNNDGDWRRSLIALLETMRADRSLLLSVARSADLSTIYRRLLKGSFTPLVRESIDAWCSASGLSDDECSLAADFYAAGLIEVSLTWLEDARGETPEELVSRLEGVMTSGISEMLVTRSQPEPEGAT